MSTTVRPPSCMPAPTLAGVDGCRGGWLAVVERSGVTTACIGADLAMLLEHLGTGALVGMDIPIGLPDRGARNCDLGARRLLAGPRRSSVFPAPVRGCLYGDDYAQLNALHRKLDGRGLTKQTYYLLGKIREVDRLMTAEPSLQSRIREVHPEVSFYYWNSLAPMAHKKSRLAGRHEREALIEQVWPGVRQRLAQTLPRGAFEHDDLNDAFAALWTVRRLAAGNETMIPPTVERDGLGLRMEIVA